MAVVAYDSRVNMWFAKRDYDRAIADLNELIRLDPKGVAYLNTRGNAWYAKRDFDRAIADKAMVAGYHWDLPNVGTIAKDGNGYVFTPAA